jgi:proline iminopeptidase
MYERQVHLNGLDLFYAEEGAGLPCFLLHGGPGMDHEMFVPWLSPLAASAHLFYPDFRGNGRSQRIPPGQFSIAAAVDDLEALRQMLGLEQIALLGHSFGGFVALSYALTHPAYVSHLIISCSAPSHDFRWSSRERIGSFLAAHPSLEPAPALPASDPDDAPLRLQVFQWLPLYFATYTAEVKQIAEDWATRTRYASALYAEWFTNQEPLYDLRPRLSELQMPTLILVGGHDRICPVDQARLMSQNIPRSRLVIFENCGHMPQMEVPAEYRECLREFLTEKHSQLY